jgi:hypothetical protein
VAAFARDGESDALAEKKVANVWPRAGPLACRRNPLSD